MSYLDKITSPQKAWELVQDAAAEGVFVPVIGFEMAANPDYGKAAPSVAESYGQDPDYPMSVQDTELSRVWSHQCRLAGRVLAEQPGASSESYWPTLPVDEADPGVLVRSSLASFIKSMNWPGRGGMFCDADESAEQSPDEMSYDDLVIDVALLALAMKRAWSTWLTSDSEPLSSVSSNSPIPYHLLQDQNVHYVLAACLEHCSSLLAASRSKRWVEPHDLQLRSIYTKLLLLGSQVLGGQPDAMWSVAPTGVDIESSEFVGRHGEAIRSYGAGPTGWKWSGSGLPLPRSISHGSEYGLRLPHVLWTESLVRHLFLSGTRAYRTASQIAFLLALDDDGGDIPNMSGDPFEVGLLHKTQTGQDTRVLHDLLEFAETVPSDSGALLPRPPGAFHRAIGKVIAAMLAASESPQVSVAAGKRRTGGTGAGQAGDKAILLTMALDREMERALELEVDDYRLLIPVWLPLKGGRRERRSEAAWVLGEFSVQADPTTGVRSSVCNGWLNVTTLDSDARLKASVRGRGPLLVKLFGSPLTDVGMCSDYVDSCEMIDVQDVIQPRVVLDERELLRLLSEAIPPQVAGLHAALLNSQLFFFGQNAMTWSDRIPYLMIDAIRHQETSFRSEADPSDTPDPAAMRNDAALAVAFANRSEYGDSLFDRLKIKGNDADEAAVIDIAIEIMKGIVHDGI